MQRVEALETRVPSSLSSYRRPHVQVARDRHVPTFLSRVQYPAMHQGLLQHGHGRGHLHPPHSNPPGDNYVEDQLQQTKQWLKNRIMNLN